MAANHHSYRSLSSLKRNWDHEPDYDHTPLALQSSHMQMLAPRLEPKTLAEMNFDELLSPKNYAGDGGSPLAMVSPNFAMSSPVVRDATLSASLSPHRFDTLAESVPWSVLRFEELEALSRFRVEMARPVEGDRLGVLIDDLKVVQVQKPESEAYGWRVGDKVLAVNGNRVSNQEEFNDELQKAMDAYFSHLVPLVFDISREPVIPDMGRLG